MKRKDLEIGKWYFNPMMESHGFTSVKSKYRYLRIHSILDMDFPDCNVIIFDEAITSDGEHVKIPLEGPSQCRQSNELYEQKMVLVPYEKIKLIMTNSKFGL